MTDYLILTAIASEFAAVTRALPAGHRHHAFRSHLCAVGSYSLAVVQMGLGRRSALEAASWAIEYLEPGQIIVIGTAGALRADLQLGDILLPASVVSPTGVIHDVAPIRIGGFPFASTQSERLVGRSRLVESPHVVSTMEAKTELHRSSEADAVDMESFTVVELCNQLGRNTSVVRFISDILDDYLPPEVPSLLSEQGNPRFLAIIAAIIRRPTLFKELLELRKSSRIADQAMQIWTTHFRRALELSEKKS